MGRGWQVLVGLAIVVVVGLAVRPSGVGPNGAETEDAGASAERKPGQPLTDAEVAERFPDGFPDGAPPGRTLSLVPLPGDEAEAPASLLPISPLGAPALVTSADGGAIGVAVALQDDPTTWEVRILTRTAAGVLVEEPEDHGHGGSSARLPGFSGFVALEDVDQPLASVLWTASDDSGRATVSRTGRAGDVVTVPLPEVFPRLLVSLGDRRALVSGGAVGGGADRLLLVDLRAGVVEADLALPLESAPLAVDVDGRRAVALHADGTRATIVDLATGGLRVQPLDLAADVWTQALLHGDLLYAAGRSGRVGEDAPPLTAVDLTDGAVRTEAVRRGEQLLGIRRTDGALLVGDLVDADPTRRRATLLSAGTLDPLLEVAGDERPLRTVGIVADGALLVVRDLDDGALVTVLDAADGSPIGEQRIGRLVGLLPEARLAIDDVTAADG